MRQPHLREGVAAVTEDSDAVPATEVRKRGLIPFQVARVDDHAHFTEAAGRPQDMGDAGSDKETTALGDTSPDDTKAQSPSLATELSNPQSIEQEVHSSTAEKAAEVTNSALSIPTQAPKTTSMTSTAAPTEGGAVPSDPTRPSQQEAKLYAGGSVPEGADVSGKE